MKRSFQLLQIGIVAGALSVVPAVAQTPADPASAQRSPAASSPSNPSNSGTATPNAGTAANSGQTVPGTDMNSPSRTAADYNKDHGFNFGWLGLVGLLGLLGLRRPHPHVTDRYDTRNIDNTGPAGVR